MKRYWDDYVLLKDEECIDYFNKRKKENQKTLFIMGAGFDTRMCDGIKLLFGSVDNMDLWLIKYGEASNSASLKYEENVNVNLKYLSKIIKSQQYIEKHIDMWENKDGIERAVAGPRTVKLVNECREEIDEYDSIIIDISALPQNIFFILLDKIIDIYKDDKQIYILASENYKVDKTITPVGIEENAHYFIGYGAASSKPESVPIVWIPVMGECTENQLKKFYEYIIQNAENAETCPVVPFPSINVRRADEILFKFKKILFDSWGIEKGNIIYASETNPFQVYRRICETSEHYSQVLLPLNNGINEKKSCRFVFTAVTSKLMAIGTFLAAYNLKKEGYIVNIAGLNNRGYVIEQKEKVKDIVGTDKNKVFCLCLTDSGL